MSKIAVVHLSDLHFTCMTIKKRENEYILQGLYTEFEKLIKTGHKIIIIINGDVFDYKVTNKYCDGFKFCIKYCAFNFFNNLKKYSNDMFFCFGNHELQNMELEIAHHKKKYNYNISINYLKNKATRTEILASNKFARDFFNNLEIKICENNSFVVPLNGIKIKIQNLYSSWLVGSNFSRIPNKIDRTDKENKENINTYRRLIHYHPENINNEDDYNIRFIVMHHDLKWYRPLEKLNLFKILDNRDIVLQAHSHPNYKDEYKHIERIDNELRLPLFVQSGALNFNSNYLNQVFFNIIKINSENEDDEMLINLSDFSMKRGEKDFEETHIK